MNIGCEFDRWEGTVWVQRLLFFLLLKGLVGDGRKQKKKKDSNVEAELAGGCLK